MTSLFWFRNDLRLDDNPGLTAAAHDGDLACLYILDDADTRGAASRVWLHHALIDLRKTLDALGIPLLIARGDSHDILHELAAKHDVTSVHWNRHYEPWMVARDTRIKESLRAKNIKVESHRGSVLVEPWAIKTGGGTPFRVFTPFYKAALALGTPEAAPDLPDQVRPAQLSFKSLSIDDLELLPIAPRWDVDMASHWTIGEDGAHTRLEEFLEDIGSHYKAGRDIPSEEYTSRLSPYLAFGHISPGQIVRRCAAQGGDHAAFIREIYWREFSMHLLFHNPELPHLALQPGFRAFPWLPDTEALKRWQTGMTGYPIVDAGMRQLWQTGWMHNRVRMIVASFLVKHLLQDWQAGEAWFWDCLVDADLANNSASWQWVAGCGADAAPYFRVFNPILQGEKFDPEGRYVRQWVPELAELPDTYIHQPWTYKGALNYPAPIIEHKRGRERALEAYQSLKKSKPA